MKVLLSEYKKKEEALNFLRKHSLGMLVTTDAVARTAITPLYFYTGDDFTIYFLTKEKTRKFQNILQLSHTSLCTYSEEEKTVIEVDGTAQPLNDTIMLLQVIEWFELIVKSRNTDSVFLPPISQLDAGNYVGCTIKPKKITFRKFATDRTEEPKEYIFNF